jgi:hypothetical protein
MLRSAAASARQLTSAWGLSLTWLPCSRKKR